jgi:hypothetical protein
MTAGEVSQRLAEIALKREEHQTADWLLAREQDELRHRLRFLNAVPAKDAKAA